MRSSLTRVSKRQTQPPPSARLGSALDSMAELAISEFLDALNRELQNLAENPLNGPLHSDQVDAIQRCAALVNNDVHTKNTPKRRARRILSDIWKYSPSLFVLCSLAMYPSKIGMLKATNYMESIAEWQKTVEIPPALSPIVRNYPDLLPSVSLSCQESIFPLSPTQLLEFFIENFGMVGVALQRHSASMPGMEMRLPYHDASLPYIRVNQHVKIELSWKAAYTMILRSRSTGLM